MNRRVSAGASAVARRMADKPPPMRFFDEVDLLARLLVNGVNPQKVEWISYLGNRIVGSNAGRRFVLR